MKWELRKGDANILIIPMLVVYGVDRVEIYQRLILPSWAILAFSRVGSGRFAPRTHMSRIRECGYSILDRWGIRRKVYGIRK